MAAARAWDIVVYGATGFTGRLVSRYLAQHAPADMRIAVAGRDEAKLTAIRDSLKDVAPAGRDVGEIGVLVADALDEDRIGEVARSTRVVIAAAGPFAKYGTPLALAAARSGTHYADITGETPWVRSIIDTADEDARANGAIMVPMAGFDSVPADMGVFFTLGKVRELRGGSATRAIRAYVRTIGGGMSGGTVASGINMIGDAEAGAVFRDPLGLVPAALGTAADAAVGGTPSAGPGTAAIAPVADRWWYDWREEAGAYAVPWAMEGLNTRCVRRSAALAAAAGRPVSAAGEAFEYTEWATTSQLGKAISSAAGGVAGRSFLAVPGAVSLVSGCLPAPGTGPSEADMARARVEYTFHADPSAAGADPVVTRLSIAMDGYMATAVFVVEAALALAGDAASLPGAGGGVLTPAAAFGQTLVDRIAAADGFAFEVVERSD